MNGLLPARWLNRFMLGVRTLNELKIPWLVSNIGDTKTLVIHPSSTIAAHLSQEEKELSGVYDDMIRISVGIEDIEDLKEDFKRVIGGDDENGKS